LTIHNLDSGQRLAELQLPGAGTIDGLRTRPEGGHEAWFRYTDLVTPPTICRIDAGYCKPEIVSDSARPKLMDVRTERVEYISVDGTLVRLSLLTAAGSDHGPRPTILHAYGGFGVPTTPHYDPMMLAWIQAGGAVAVAAVRGGSEEGADWHRAGQRAYKQRSVEDFIAAAEWLIAKRRTTPQTLAALGGSNGGLLVAAALTQRPELFAAAVCCAPLTDMMRFGRFGRAAPWRHEYGDATQPEDVASLIAYSPYHRVRERVPYPAVLVAAFAGDTRVHPMHARKLCAALQYATSSEAPVLLREEAGVGHGQRSASRALHLAADILAFVADRTGLKDPVVVREVQDDEC
jgi:prolyl oligopeptidase